MADISSIKLPNNTVVNIKDSTARSAIPTKVSQLTNDSNFYSEPTYGIGTADPITRPLIETVRANRLAFLPASQIIIEQTTDGGTTWTDAGVSDSTKAGLFAGTRPTVNLPLLNGARSTNCGLRVTITAMRYNVPSGTAETAKYNYWNSTYVASQERYCSIDKFWFWIGANGDRQRIKVESATGASPNNWRTKFNTDFGANGWSGSDWVKTSYGAFGGGTNQTGNEWNWRITFFSRMADGASAFTQTSKQAIYQIMAYGENVWGASNNLMKTDRIYAYDANQNATFPAKVTATGGFVGSVSDVTTQGSATNSTARHIWFSDSSTETKRAHSDNFKYTPSTNTITANLSGSATLTGTPTAPTASAGTNNTQIATTAFVKRAIDNAGGGGNTLVFTNKTVAASAWSTNSDLDYYGYRASIALTGVTASMMPQVTFTDSQLAEYDLAPICQSYAGGVYIYSAEAISEAITIPSIGLIGG